MFEDLFDDVSPVAFGVVYSIGLLLMLVVVKRWNTSVATHINLFQIILFAVLLLPICYFILKRIADSD